MQFEYNKRVYIRRYDACMALGNAVGVALLSQRRSGDRLHPVFILGSRCLHLIEY